MAKKTNRMAAPIWRANVHTVKIIRKKCEILVFISNNKYLAYLHVIWSVALYSIVTNNSIIWATNYKRCFTIYSGSRRVSSFLFLMHCFVERDIIIRRQRNRLRNGNTQRNTVYITRTPGRIHEARFLTDLTSNLTDLLVINTADLVYCCKENVT
jgi:hypothetical protein